MQDQGILFKILFFDTVYSKLQLESKEGVTHKKGDFRAKSHVTFHLMIFVEKNPLYPAEIKELNWKEVT
jgi:hypothetical protein